MPATKKKKKKKVLRRVLKPERQLALMNKWLEGLKLPEGFEIIGPCKTIDEHSCRGDSLSWLVLIHKGRKRSKVEVRRSDGSTHTVDRCDELGDIEIRIDFSFDRNEYWYPESRFTVYGHTSFETKNGRRTFDRPGCDDSFYAGEFDDAQKIIQGQLDRIKESRERHERAIRVPGLQSFTCTPEEKEDRAKELREKGRTGFYPAGFGRGYDIHIGRENRWEKKAPRELEDFFGMYNLYIRELDCD